MQRSEAEEHLRVIRSLMEKATMYRAISAPTALIGGILSLALGALLFGPMKGMAEQPAWFFGPWFLVLGITAAANGYFIRRDAQRRGDPFISPGMKMALKALVPSHLVAGFATALSLGAALGFFSPSVAVEAAACHFALPVIWCVAYGMGLLAMEHFAPRSLVHLGWGFLTVGLVVGAALFFRPSLPGGMSATQIANGTMALTFGLFHIIYAVCAWPRGDRTGGHS